jgi:hypothetical protein
VKFKLLISLLLGLCFLNKIEAQSELNGNQILLLKDKGIVVQSYTVGDHINFEFSNKQWLTGYIDRIRNDSVQINQYALQSTISMVGTYGQDTLQLGKLSFHINEMIAFPKEKGYYNSVFTNGAFLITGGIGYVGLNIFNTLSNKDQIFARDNIPKLIGGVLAWAGGVLIHKTNPNYRPIGKRFTVEIL